MAICVNCEEEYNDKRLALGYSTCLDCGEVEAQGIIAARTHNRARVHRGTFGRFVPDS